MNSENEKTLRGYQEQLRAGISAVEAERQQAEADVVEHTKLRAAVNGRLGVIHPNSPEADALTADLAKLRIWDEWQRTRPARRDTVCERLAAAVRVATGELHDQSGVILPFAFEKFVSRDTAVASASQCIDAIERQIAYRPPSPAVRRTESFITAAD